MLNKLSHYALATFYNTFIGIFSIFILTKYYDFEDFGKIALEKYKLVEKIINKGSDRATRCVEIAGGSPLTEKEINATKKSEINTECPSIANPNYESY